VNAQVCPVDATTFARLTGVPKSTVLHRYHRFVDRCDPAIRTRQEMWAALTRPTERRIMVTLDLPGRQQVSGGVRAVIRAILGNPALEQSRAERLSFSGIRARLRRVPGWPEHPEPAALLRAFGFQAGAEPPARCWPVMAA
jgi:hypothetical protein